MERRRVGGPVAQHGGRGGCLLWNAVHQGNRTITQAPQQWYPPSLLTSPSGNLLQAPAAGEDCGSRSTHYGMVNHVMEVRPGMAVCPSLLGSRHRHAGVCQRPAVSPDVVIQPARRASSALTHAFRERSIAWPPLLGSSLQLLHCSIIALSSNDLVHYCRSKSAATIWSS